MLYWHPPDYFAADPTIIEHRGRFHLFFESTTAQPIPGEPRGPLVICHYVSDDLEKWSPLPNTIRVGPAGAWDGYLLYHLDVIVVDETWWMFYTGLDKAGAGQRQQIGIATSRDGITWTKHAENPVLSNTRYERSIPPEASHRSGNKDLGREWFRDPMVIFDPPSKRWIMAVVARDPEKPVDTRACVAGFSSPDLIHWRDEGPIYSPGRFHTVETPSIVEHDGRHFLVYMSSTTWGVPIFSSDSHQNAGNFVAVSNTGPLGPFHALEDEILIASANSMRFGAQRILPTADGRHMLYGWLGTRPGRGDGPSDGTRANVFPTLKPVTFNSNHVHVGMPDCLIRLQPAPLNLSATVLKNYTAPALSFVDVGSPNLFISTHIHFHAGERAGLLFRFDPEMGTGLFAVLDRRRKRVELGSIGRASTLTPVDSAEVLTDAAVTGGESQLEAFLDARAWSPTDSARLAVACDGVSIEVYVDGRLMLHQARHRERGRSAGVMTDHAHASFSQTSYSLIHTSPITQ